ncbi:MAG: hypothetical protein HN704_05140 [Bacteroidetes bacterium]|jgi:hypothetical protein|nr:hypothetical protein [Bacteroidota bacterium]MBT6685881.1 hypothetical protein [Bacteroidota bacterium]MBT7144055.1 hypothetical protein [Bacteroidota bacterium]MBT7490977.1 hypothetical protein [Bacteroidota bacterium]
MKALKIVFFLSTFFFFSFVGNEVFAQSTIQPDSVCAGETVYYQLNGNSASTYTWSILGATGGSIVSGNTTDSIMVNWPNAGMDSIQVVETNEFGCSGEPYVLTVEILDLPTAIISGIDTVCYGEASSSLIEIVLTGTSDWEVVISDQTVNDTISVIASPYYYTTPNLFTPPSVSYTVVSVTDGNGCSNTGTGSATVVVSPALLPLTIFHD